MQGSLIAILLMLSTAAQARIFKYGQDLLERARAQNLVASQTLIIKTRNVQSLQQQYSQLGEFRPFFQAHDGTWGYFKLAMIPDARNANKVLDDFEHHPDITHAYYAPIPKHASFDTEPVEEEYHPTLVETPDFEHLQNYLQDSPRGVGAMSAWHLPGGTGRNVRVIDIETCFEERHEDFRAPFFVGGNNPECGASIDHGTAVWGQIAAKRDGKGVTGIAHEADFGIYGFPESDWSVVNDQYIEAINKGIKMAIDELEAGDVLVIEQQMMGPLGDYTAVEYWPHIFEMLKKATDKGIICLQAAGNHGSNFDDPRYQGAFDLRMRDSGCIIVGAVDAEKRERLSFPNYGSRIDAAGFGRGVFTTGYGDLFNAGPERRYTARFSGTSSATPIVAGAVAVVSSVAKEEGRIIAPREMRLLLRQTGARQGPNTRSKRVGNLPNIQQMLERIQRSN